MPTSSLLAGASTANITPSLGSSLAGGMVDRIATDVHDELHVRALVLDDGASRIAFAVCDLCAIDGGIVSEARHLINSHTGIPMTNILVAATHTHSAPPAAHLFQSLPEPAYQRFLTVRIADAVRRAVNRLQPARLRYAAGAEPSLVFHRRFRMQAGSIPVDPFDAQSDRVLMNPPPGSGNIAGAAGPVDPEVAVLAVEALDGAPISLLANFALHYIGGEAPGHITADYFGMWAREVTQAAGNPGGFVPILTNGCSGNINGVNFLKPSAPAKPYEKMLAAARTLAAETLRLWKSAPVHSDATGLRASEEWVNLAVRLPSPPEVERARKILADSGKASGFRERREIYARETMWLAKHYPARVDTPVQALRVGPVAIATMPGEAFVELGLEIKQKSASKPVFVIELANDYRGYLPTVEAHRDGGYETWRAKSSYLEVEAAPKLVAAALRQLARL